MRHWDATVSATPSGTVYKFKIKLTNTEQSRKTGGKFTIKVAEKAWRHKTNTASITRQEVDSIATAIKDALNANTGGA